MKTDHFDMYYYPEEESAARMAGADGGTMVRAVLDPADASS